MSVVKKIATWLLIVFIVVAVVTKIVLRNAPQEPVALQGENIVMLFHAEARCQTCNTMESLLKSVLEKPEFDDLKIGLVLLEYDSPKNRELVERFRVGTASIIFVEQMEGEIVRSCDITPDAWHWIDYEKRFVEMLETKLTEFFRNEAVVSEDANHKTDDGESMEK